MKHKTIISLTVASILTLGVGLNAAQGDRHGGKSGKGGKHHSAERILAHLDVDGDTVISVAEYTAPKLIKAKKKFTRIDSDEDGLISLENIKNARPEKPNKGNREAMRQCVADSFGIDLPEKSSAEEYFTQADTSADGFLDWDEFSLVKVNRETIKFNKIDSDTNGEINLDELTNVVQKHKAMHQVRRDCRDEIETVNELVEG